MQENPINIEISNTAQKHFISYLWVQFGGEEVERVVGRVPLERKQNGADSVGEQQQVLYNILKQPSFILIRSHHFNEHFTDISIKGELNH